MMLDNSQPTLGKFKGTVLIPLSSLGIDQLRFKKLTYFFKFYTVRLFV